MENAASPVGPEEKARKRSSNPSEWKKNKAKAAR